MSSTEMEAAMRAMGLSPATLPAMNTVVAPTPPNREPSVSFRPLTDAEWEFVEPHLPALPVPKATDFRARDFIDATRWWIAARERGLGWGRLPQKYWPVSSREHRHRRWCELGWWRQLADALSAEQLLGSKLLREFERIAIDAEARRAKLQAARERLTG